MSNTTAKVGLTQKIPNKRFCPSESRKQHRIPLSSHVFPSHRDQKGMANTVVVQSYAPPPPQQTTVVINSGGAYCGFVKNVHALCYARY
eukprot:3008239-Rhodomonas_salina.3